MVAALRSTISRYALPGGVALTWLLTALGGTALRAPLVTQMAALIIIIPLALWALWRHPTCDERRRLLAITAVPVIVLLVASILSKQPQTALLGGEPLYQGWVLWAVLYGWFALVVLGARGTDLMWTTVTLTGAGIVVSAWAVIEYWGWVPTNDPLAASPMALFDNPNSLAQALIVTICCSIALLSRRRRLATWAAPVLLGALALQIYALMLTHSMAALVGIIVAGAVFLLLSGATSSRGPVHALGVAMLVVFVGGVLTLFVASSGLLGVGALSQTDRLLSQRPEVWEAASARVLQTPVIGTGAGRFETLTKWEALPNGDISYIMTYDPHGIAIGWLVSAGILGFAAFTVAAIKIGLRLAYAAQRPSATSSVHWLVAGAAGVGIAMLVSWPDPLVLLSLTAVVGGVIAGSIDPQASPAPRRREMLRYLAPTVAITVAASVSVAMLTLSADAEYDALHGQWKTVRQEVDSLGDELYDSKDPFYAEAQLNAVMRPGDSGLSDAETLELLRTVDTGYEQFYEGRVDLALLAVEVLWIRRDSVEPAEYWDMSRRFIDRGRMTDPTLAVWDFVEARAAISSGRPDADDYVARALGNDESPSNTDEALDAVIADAAADGQPMNVVDPEQLAP